MKRCYSPLKIFAVFALIFISFSSIYGQSFNASGAFPLSLVGATTDITGCSSNRTITFSVTGVGVLSSTNQLLEIDLRLRSNRRLYGAIFLQAPNGGPCIQIADRYGDGSTYNAQNILLDYKFRAPNPCLSKYPDYGPTSGQVYTGDVDSRSGVFATVGNISTAFNGVNANGTWTMYFGRGNASNEPPAVMSAGLTFGSPLSISPPDPNAGNSCANAVVWSGTPLCATTAGKVDTPNRPAPNISGCNGWMSTSENNLWIAFTPTEPDVCINISGVQRVSGAGAQGVQSIIVSPTNPGTPCDNAWTVANCPRDGIYASNVGSTMSHNHCFTAVPGQTYYLIVDGNAGAVTEVYLTGIDGLPVILAAELISFNYECKEDAGELKWVTASESNNDYFVIDYSENGQEWLEIGRKQGSGSKKTATDYSFLISQRMMKGYFRLKQVDFDGKETKLRTIVSTDCGTQKELKVVPNPSTGIIHLLNLKDFSLDLISVIDVLGNEVHRANVQNEMDVMTMDLSTLPKGIYILVSTSKSGERNTQRIIIE